MPIRTQIQRKQSMGSKHNLLPAMEHTELLIVPHVDTSSIIAWSFGRGSVVWRIWPAVLFHIAFAAAVVSLDIATVITLEIPPVLLTVLGVVIGFVISYRAMSGYDRYWLGRSCWADIIRNSRAMGRLIWFHVPPHLTAERKGDKHEMLRVMKEKRMALDLIEGFAVALKHHLRGEVGIYYEDLYSLIEPLHDHHDLQSPASPRSPQTIQVRPSKRAPRVEDSEATLSNPSTTARDQVIASMNTYGSFNESSSSLSVNPPPNPKAKSKGRAASHHSDISQVSADCHSDGEHERLLGRSELETKPKYKHKISGDLIPFMSFFSWAFGWKKDEDEEPGLPTSQDNEGGVGRKWIGQDDDETNRRPRVAGEGESIPSDVLNVLSEWVSVLEARGSVPGGSLGSIAGCIANFEQSMSALEMILTTPLPFVYSAHIRHTVWIYLFFLPFQLVSEFGWSTIGGVGIAAFIYLGFLAAGEEIEQPFGYDTNDLDLDLFTGKIIHGDMDDLKKTTCLNAYRSHQSDLSKRSIVDTIETIETKKRLRSASIPEWDADGDGEGDGYGISDDVFGIRS